MPLQAPQGLRALDEPGLDLDSINPEIAGYIFGSDAPDEGTLPDEEPAPSDEAPSDPALDSDEDSTLHDQEDALDEPEEEEDDTAAAADDDSSAAVPKSLPELAKHLDWSEEDLVNLNLPVTVDGEKGEATIRQLRDSYQIQSHLSRQQRAMEERSKAVEAELTQTRSQVQDEYTRLQETIKMLEEQMVPPEPDPELRRDDVAEWNAQMYERQQALQNLDKFRTHISARRQAEVQEQLRRYQAQRAERLQEGHRKLLEYEPNWNEEKAKVAKFLGDTFGFSVEEIQATEDHRMAQIAHMAMKYATAAESQREVARKKVAKAPPKVMKPGVSRGEETGVSSLLKLHQRARKTGNVEDAYAVLVGAKDMVRRNNG